MILIERLRVLIYEKFVIIKKEVKNLKETKRLTVNTKTGNLK